MLTTLFLAATFTCSPELSDHTEALQAAIDSNPELAVEGHCFIKGVPGLVLPSDRTLLLEGATLEQLPNVGGSGWLGRNRILSTLPGSSNIHIKGGTLIGSHVEVAGLQFQIGLHINSSSNVTVEGTTFLKNYFDGITIGGNPPGSTKVRIKGITVSGSRRNAISITSGSDIWISSSTLQNTTCNPDWKTQQPYNPLTACGDRKASNYYNNMPLCAIDFEPNAGEEVSNVVVLGNLFKDNQKCGVFLQSNYRTGGQVLLYGNRCEGNGTWCIAANQVSNVVVAQNTATGGSLGYSFGAGLRELVFVGNTVEGNTGNALNLAGVWNPYVAQFNGNGRPTAILSIPTPWLGAGTTMNGVAGAVTLR